MLNFYSNVQKYGNSILYRGYENGRRIQSKIKFSPTLYLENDKSGEDFITLDGKKLSSKRFDCISEASQFISSMQGVHGFKYYGMENWILSYISDTFPGLEVEFDFDQINIGYIDIEVAKTDNGYSSVEDADGEVTTIVIQNRDKFIIFGTKPYAIHNEKEKYIRCLNEKDLLSKFLRVWAILDLDIVSGWFIEMFDIPYLVNRIRKIIGKESANALSPWRQIKERKVDSGFGKEETRYELVGISVLDYKELFDKFTYTTPENWKLDTIAHMILDEKKIDYSEFRDLDDLYSKDYDKFIQYNIKDVALVSRMEEKLKLIFLVTVMAYSSKVNYNDCFKNTVIWDSVIYNYLKQKNTIVPQKVRGNKSARIAGGHVKIPKLGKYGWVASFDLTSLYPSLFMHYNISPETFVGISSSNKFLPIKTDGEKDTVNSSLVMGENYDEPSVKQMDLSIAANGTMYSKDRRGFIPEITEKVFNERQYYKKKMLESKKKLEKERKNLSPDEVKEIEYNISFCDVMQQNFKIMINALYGSTANAGFRFYDPNIAEAITLSGQLSVKWIEYRMNKFMNEKFKTDNEDYVVLIDTDSIFVNLEKVADKVKNSVPDIHDFIQKFCIDVLQKKIEEWYLELHEYMNSYDTRLSMKLEKIASGLITVAKKRYFCDVVSNEGVRYAESQIAVTGIEAVRSSTPEFCRDKLKESFAIILRKTEKEAQKFIEDVELAYQKLTPEEIGIPTGVNGLFKYADKSNIYKKGTPMHVRAALMHNHYLKENGLHKKLNMIQEGEKIKFLMLKVPNPVGENVFAFPSYLPRELNLENHIDRNAMFTRSFVSPLETIFNAIGWKVRQENTLEDLFM